MNRGVRKSDLFLSTADYEAFFAILREAPEHAPIRLLAVCLMRNHWHMVLWPKDDGDLSRYVGWLSLTHACRWQRVHGTRGTGCVYQGRFKAVPIESGIHLLIALRYVEANARRAGVVERAEDWPWSSASSLLGSDMPTLHRWPIDPPTNWRALLNEAQPAAGLDLLRTAVRTSAPFGSDAWREQIVAKLGWKPGIRPVGRPREITPGVIVT
jgi:putative transposase